MNSTSDQSNNSDDDSINEHDLVVNDSTIRATDEHDKNVNDTPKRATSIKVPIVTLLKGRVSGT